MRAEAQAKVDKLGGPKRMYVTFQGIVLADRDDYL